MFALEQGGSGGGNLLPVNGFPTHRLLFVTGTDTGVGKTLLTALLISHLRRLERPALAIKPFCSGDRADAQLLHDLQRGDLALEEVNPFFFEKPLAPLVASRQEGRLVRLEEVIGFIHSIIRRFPRGKRKNRSELSAPILLIEGAGGLLVPLGPGYFILDLIRELRCEVIVVSANKLGTLNHSLLTIAALGKECPYLCAEAANGAQIGRKDKPVEVNKLQRARFAPPKIVLMEPARRDASANTNPDVLSEFLAPMPLWKLPFLRGNLQDPLVIEKTEKKIQKTLAQILG